MAITYNLNIEAAIDAIATLEDAITTPTPGITTAYGFGENPSSISAPSLLPAVVHINRGPVTVDTNPATLKGVYYIQYDIESILLAIEASPDQYPADEAATSKFWKSVCETFFDGANQSSLATSAGARYYRCLFLNSPSWTVRQWPPQPAEALNWYWSLSYTHRFIV